MSLVNPQGEPIGKGPAEHLPFQPESLPELRNRYPDAVEKIWNLSRFNIDDDRAYKHRRHVFDHKFGIRLIISIDFAPLSTPELRGPFEHVSASIFPGKLAVPPGKTAFEEFHRIYFYLARVDMKTFDLHKRWVTEDFVIHLLINRLDLKAKAKREILGEYPEEN